MHTSPRRPRGARRAASRRASLLANRRPSQFDAPRPRAGSSTPGRRRGLAAWLSALALLLGAADASAEVVGFVESGRRPVLDGHAWGDAGAYEYVTGTLHYAVDPANPANAAIVDLQRAPRASDGRVAFHGDVTILRPSDPARAAGTALVEVCNRGGKAALSYFCAARGSSDPREPEHFGDGLLLERGLTVVWVGWQFDVPRQPERLRLHVPRVAGLEGLARADWSLAGGDALLPLAHREHVPYEPADPSSARDVLTHRETRDAVRRTLPRESWTYVGLDGDPSGREAVAVADPRAGDAHTLAGVYELVYTARDPAVVGLGLAAVRDVAAWLEHDPSCPAPVQRSLAVGISQTGRFLRQFVWQGFNVDEAGRRAYEGLLVHSAGAGRGSFNHRFAQPSRDGHPGSAYFYPTDLFPFSGRVQRDPLTGLRGGILAAHDDPALRPRVMFTNTGYEYWGRAGALLHTSLDGSADVEPLPDERIYHLASTQHFVDRWPPRQPHLRSHGSWLGNPVDLKKPLRALLLALQDWVERDVAPPDSRHPRIDDDTLVPASAWRGPPPFSEPPAPHLAWRADYGPRFRSEGVVEHQPPRLGPAFPALVPRLDAFGNERGGVPTLETAAPVASAFAWDGAHDFLGLWWPLPRDAVSPRPGLVQTWGDREGYLARARAAADELVAQRWLLPRDVDAALARAAEMWDFAWEADVDG